MHNFALETLSSSLSLSDDDKSDEGEGLFLAVPLDLLPPTISTESDEDAGRRFFTPLDAFADSVCFLTGLLDEEIELDDEQLSLDDEDNKGDDGNFFCREAFSTDSPLL